MQSDPTVSIRTRGLLVFPIGELWFGARVEEVAGLVEAERLVPLPGQRDPIAGVLAFRGSMVPTLDLVSFLDAGPVPRGTARYALVMTRGADRFGILVPALPRLVPARELKEAELATPDSDVGSLIDSLYEAGGRLIHCLNYGSVIDTTMPRTAPKRSGAMVR